MSLPLRSISEILEAEVLSGEEYMDRPVGKVAATDLMSSVLAFSEPEMLLVTGLVNVQVVNTADLAGLAGVVFVQGVRPSEVVITKARTLAVPMMLTRHSMFHVCGLLYGHGLTSI